MLSYPMPLGGEPLGYSFFLRSKLLLKRVGYPDAWMLNAGPADWPGLPLVYAMFVFRCKVDCAGGYVKRVMQ
jgi:hypothetical protein